MNRTLQNKVAVTSQINEETFAKSAPLDRRLNDIQEEMGA